METRQVNLLGVFLNEQGQPQISGIGLRIEITNGQIGDITLASETLPEDFIAAAGADPSKIDWLQRLKPGSPVSRGDLARLQAFAADSSVLDGLGRQLLGLRSGRDAVSSWVNSPIITVAAHHAVADNDHASYTELRDLRKRDTYGSRPFPDPPPESWASGPPVPAAAEIAVPFTKAGVPPFGMVAIALSTQTDPTGKQQRLVVDETSLAANKKLLFDAAVEAHHEGRPDQASTILALHKALFDRANTESVERLAEVCATLATPSPEGIAAYTARGNARPDREQWTRLNRPFLRRVIGDLGDRYQELPRRTVEAQRVRAAHAGLVDLVQPAQRPEPLPGQAAVLAVGGGRGYRRVLFSTPVNVHREDDEAPAQVTYAEGASDALFSQGVDAQRGALAAWSAGHRVKAEKLFALGSAFLHHSDRTADSDGPARLAADSARYSHFDALGSTRFLKCFESRTMRDFRDLRECNPEGLQQAMEYRDAPGEIRADVEVTLGAFYERLQQRWDERTQSAAQSPPPHGRGASNRATRWAGAAANRLRGVLLKGGAA